MDYYCSTKFTDLNVHVSARLLYNCCAAFPERINLDWLESNPGRLFHTDTMIADRKLMLENKSCKSCHYGCYRHEEQGISSARQMNTLGEYISNPYSPLKNITINLTTDCNLSCMYCSPTYSSAWQREIHRDGKYEVPGLTVDNTNWSNAWAKMKQKNRGADTRFFSLLLKEIEMCKELNDLNFMGGEPLLNNQITDILTNVKANNISVTTGLGVSDQRLKDIISKTKGLDIQYVVSAEATGPHFEFIRYGLSWEDFKRRVKILQDADQRIEFISSVNNISMFDLHHFFEYAGETPVSIKPVVTPALFQSHVLDEVSKQAVKDKMKQFPKYKNKIYQLLDRKTKELNRIGVGLFLKQLSTRRAIDLNFLPDHFLEWCGINTS